MLDLVIEVNGDADLFVGCGERGDSVVDDPLVLSFLLEAIWVFDFCCCTTINAFFKKKIEYKGFTIEKDWLGMYSVDGYTTNKLWKIEEFIDNKINENPELENYGDE